MTNTLRNLISVVLVGMTSLGSLYSDAIEGEYLVKGYDPYEKAAYAGEATIKLDKNNVYQLKELTNGLTYIGTGLVCCPGTLVFVVRGPHIVKEDKVDLSLVTYKMQGDQLNGTWVLVKNSLIGTEELVRKPVSNSKASSKNND